MRCSNHAVRASVLAGLAVLAHQVGSARAQQCQTEWAGISTAGPDNSVSESVVFDDGSGPALFIGGRFSTIGSAQISGVAKWNGQSWSSLAGLRNDVRALAVFNDGTGDALYAAGLANGQSGVYKWDGQAWSLVGGEYVDGGEGAIECLTVFDDGSGPALYAGGSFASIQQAGQLASPAINIIRWNGVSWSTVGNGLGSECFALNESTCPGVYDLAVFDEGQGAGPQLFACGDFDGFPTTIAKWDGASWLSLPTGLGVGDHLYSMAAFRDGSGPALYVGGTHTQSDGQYGRVYRWDGASWTSIADGTDFGDSGADSKERFVNTLFTFDDGAGPALYVGGAFPIVSGVPVTNIAKWNGQSWSAVGGGGVGVWNGNPAVQKLGTFNGGLLAAGAFSIAGGLPAASVARLACDPLGACCFPSGMCAATQTRAACTFNSGTFTGDNTACETSPACVPAPTGACCLNGGVCSVLYNIGAGGCLAQAGLYQGDGATCASANCAYADTEPNNTKQQANAILLSSGGAIQGTSAGADVDYFLIRTPAASLGIYRQRMTLVNPTTPGNTASIRAVSQSSADSGPWPCSVGTGNTNDGVAQSSVNLVANTPTNTWYGFGKGEQVYYRVAGTAATTGLYTATLQTTQVIPTDLGAFQAGSITITTTGQGYTTDTALRVYSATLDPIPGYSNDNQSANGGGADSGNTSFLRRDYAPGTYYLGLSVSALASSVGAPCDDRKRNGPMMDFPNVAVDADPASTATGIPFTISDSAGPTVVPVTRGQQEISWFKFTVVGSGGVCCRGATCNTTITSAGDCTATGTAGAVFSGAESACNAATISNAPCCYADYNKANGITVQDIFDFLSDWFAGSPFASVGGDGAAGSLTVQNIFDFLSNWFTGGCG
jgi:hypothetical protein